MENQVPMITPQCSLAQLVLEIGVVYRTYKESLFISIDLNTVRGIQREVLLEGEGKYALFPPTRNKKSHD